MPIAPRERKILIFTTLLSAVALLYHFLLDPFFKEWRELSTEIRMAEARLQKTRFLLKKKMEIEAVFQKYAAISKEESGEVMTGILQEVEGLSQKAQLEILDMRPLPQKKKGFFKRSFMRHKKRRA